MYLTPPKTVEILDFFASINVRLELLERSETLTPKMKFYVSGETVEIYDGHFLVTVSGNGTNVNSALKDYASQISNKRIRYRGLGEIFYMDVPKLVHTKYL